MKILVIDDEKLARFNVISQLSREFEIAEANSFETALEKLQENNYDICYIDLKLDHSKKLLGLELIPWTVKKGIYTVVLTSVKDDDIVEMAYERGCQDVYNKGNEKGHISETINRYLLTKEEFTEDVLFRDLIPTKSKK